jgi:CDP-paratose 2-epimerase
MSVALVTGSAGLIGAEAVRFFHKKGLDVVGMDNDMRRYFFGDEASTKWSRQQLESTVSKYRHYDVDIRDADAVDKVFKAYGASISVIIHTASR